MHPKNLSNILQCHREVTPHSWSGSLPELLPEFPSLATEWLHKRCRATSRWHCTRLLDISITDGPRLLSHWPWSAVRCSRLGEGEMFEYKDSERGLTRRNRWIIEGFTFYNGVEVIYEKRGGCEWKRGWVVPLLSVVQKFWCYSTTATAASITTTTTWVGYARGY